ncbi:carbohydrate esterase family 8 protein [Mucidula mucida]|nr:carbohydrate esterase family 8 protein [Mucidula mucida]
MYSFCSRITLFSLVLLFCCAFVLPSPVDTKFNKREIRTSPPDGAVVVRGNGAESGEYTTIQDAVDSLPDDATEQVIFVYAGTYEEQVYVERDGQTTIMGATDDTSSYTGNTVTITYSMSAGEAGNDDESGTLRVHKDDFALYNVDIKNTFGQASSDGQALALSAYGTGAYYGVGFYSYQDTILAQSGNQFYASCYIEGAVDYIFGQEARAFFHQSTIASIGAGAITANGRDSEDGESLYVINESDIITSVDADGDLSGQVYLGRPWRNFARVVYISCTLGDLINSAGWEAWSSSDPRTDNICSPSDGAADSSRASFATTLSSASGYGIADVLGDDYAGWVDSAYV